MMAEGMGSAASLASSIVTWTTGGVGLGAGAIVSIKFLDWLGGRVDKREAAVAAGAARLDAATEKLIQNMTARLDKYEERIASQDERIAELADELRECQQKHAESDAKVMRLEAIMQGYGDAREKAQLIVSAEKQRGANNDG